MSHYLPDDQVHVIMNLLTKRFSYRRIAAMTGTSRDTIERYAQAQQVGVDRDGNPLYGWKRD